MYNERKNSAVGWCLMFGNFRSSGWSDAYKVTSVILRVGIKFEP